MAGHDRVDDRAQAEDVGSRSRRPRQIPKWRIGHAPFVEAYVWTGGATEIAKLDVERSVGLVEEAIVKAKVGMNHCIAMEMLYGSDNLFAPFLAGRKIDGIIMVTIDILLQGALIRFYKEQTFYPLVMVEALVAKRLDQRLYGCCEEQPRTGQRSDDRPIFQALLFPPAGGMLPCRR